MSRSGSQWRIAGITRALGLGDGGSLRRGSNLVDIGVAGAMEDEPPAFTVFAAMPFDPSFDDVFFVAIRRAVREVGGRAVRIDQTMHGGDAVMATRKQLQDCRAVIADVSTGEPDVLYELGLAHALGKPSIQICRTAHQDLPFMVRNHETLLYQAGRTHLLGEQLALYLRAVLSHGN
jgi:hypothetical protein